MNEISRRKFIQSAAATGAAISSFNILSSCAQAEMNTSKIKIALIGCGGRGAGAVENFLEAAKLLGIEVEVVAITDAFKDRVDWAAKRLKLDASLGHYGFDAYKKAAASDAEVVLMATPPNFRPLHFEACVNAGKHCFIEKPVAVDPPGIRKVMEVGEKAAQKGLSVVAGTQRRYNQNYLNMISQIQQGAIGEVVGGNVYWNMGTLWKVKQTDGMSNAEFLARNWLNFGELSGDHIVEQHVHQLDVMNWIMGRPPKAFIGYGGCARREIADGNQFDFFSVNIDYGDGVSIHSQCRQIAGCYNRVGEEFRGTEGFTSGTKLTGKEVSVPPLELEHASGIVQEHVELIKSIRGKAEPINAAVPVAEATLLAIGGRIAAYTGKLVRWVDLTKNTDSEFYNLTMAPAALDFEKGEVALPDMNPPIPGVEKEWKVRK